MQLVKVLKGKEPSMKRVVFAKNALFIGGLWSANAEDLKMKLGNLTKKDGVRKNKKSVFKSGGFQK